jgi:hypothetical protein
MREWLERQLAAGLPAFAGSQMSGTLVVRQEAINELIAAWLTGGSPAAGGPALDVTMVRSAIKSAAVRGEPGRILVDFEIRL